jgi:(4-O-methyl)-D-glucuronate---lignin esterase
MALYRSLWISMAMLVAAPMLLAGHSSEDELLEGFRAPPLPARPSIYWTWVNGLTDKDRQTAELEELKAKGIGGVYIFDVGAQDPQGIVPTGPAFMGPESLDAIGHTVREATRLGMEVGLVTSSSWNCGGPWIPPKYASMGLYHRQMTVTGPTRLNDPLPMPALPGRAPRGPDGKPAYVKDVAILAVPAPRRLPGHEFVFEVAPPGTHTIDRVVLYNTASGDEKRYGPTHLFAKDFAVYAATDNGEPDAFKEIARGTLEPHAEAQTFRFEPVRAWYVKLVLLSGHNPKSDRIQLGEFEVYSTDGANVAWAYNADGSRTGASLLHSSSALGTETEQNWTAANIHDGAKSGPAGSWSSAGLPPLIIESPEVVVDVTERVDKDGHLDWDVPAGEWIIMRFVCANTGLSLRLPSPKSGGLAIDHFSAEATKFHFQYLLDKLHEELGDFKDTALKQMYVCSYELSGSTWTPEFLKQFAQRRGYDMTKYLPILAGCTLKDQQAAQRFEYDYRKTLGDLLVDAFYKAGTELSNEHGLLLCAEAGGPGPPLHQVPVDALKALGALDIPRGEFWKDHNVWVVKETACAAHIYGKPQVDMEAFTSWRHWQDGPFELKPIADRAFCGGANHFTFHTSAHNPSPTDRPGWVYHAGTHMNPSIAWWPKAKPWIDYLSRCSYMLQQGVFVADVCYYYGDQGYNFVPPKHIDPSLGYGYDYDVTNAEVILTRMSVKDGRITLPDGVSYELLVLPKREDIDLDVLKRVERMVKAGATVVGPKPICSNGLGDHAQRDAEVRQIANRLWGPCDGTTCKEHTYGKGRIVWGKNLRDILTSRKIGPDFETVSVRSDIQHPFDYIHRRTAKADLYFVSNKSDRWESVLCMFRVSDKVPQLWMPDTGEIRACEFGRDADDTTQVRLRLAPYGSVFVVFREAGESVPKMDWMSASDEGRGIAGPWQVRFPEGWGAPASKTLPELVSWPEVEDEGVKYFSGIASYHNEFNVEANEVAEGNSVFLDLGEVRFVAEVYVNGESQGIVWKPPYRVDITDAIRTGANQLVVEVANTWSNRLVGDARTPEGKQFCRTNIVKSLTWQVPWKETPLLESGLLGPVKLISGVQRNGK